MHGHLDECGGPLEALRGHLDALFLIKNKHFGGGIIVKDCSRWGSGAVRDWLTPG